MATYSSYQREPLARIRRGALLLLLVMLVSISVYRLSGEYSWLEALWLVIVTISTVGYSETSQMPPPLQVFTILVILVGLSIAAYTFTGAIQLLLAGEMDKVLGVRRMHKQISQLDQHVVICGVGRIGRHLAEELHSRQMQYVVIENDPEKLDDARELGFLMVDGDATDEEVLIRAGAERAKTIVTTLPSDAANVFITLTVREVNPQIRVVAVAEQEKTCKKLRRAGADRIVMPTVVGARQFARMITHPFTADLMDLVAEKTYLDLELDEIHVGASHPLKEMSVQDSEAHRRYRLLVIAIRKQDGSMVFSPDAGYRFLAGDIAIVMGNRSDIDGFRRAFPAELSG